MFVARSIVAPRVSAISAPASAAPRRRTAQAAARQRLGRESEVGRPTALLGDLGGKAHSEAKLGAIESPVELGERA